MLNLKSVSVSSGPDIKRLYLQAGVELKATSFLFVDTQVADESFLEDIITTSSAQARSPISTRRMNLKRCDPSTPTTSWFFGLPN